MDTKDFEIENNKIVVSPVQINNNPSDSNVKLEIITAIDSNLLTDYQTKDAILYHKNKNERNYIKTNYNHIANYSDSINPKDVIGKKM